MARFILVRHGHTQVTGKVVTGRMPGIHLSAEGREQARRLVPLLDDYRIDQIISSPLERAMQTAAPLGERLGKSVNVDEALTEVAFGEWEGRSVKELEDDEQWRRFNSYRSGTLIPGGENMHQVQARMVTALQRMHETAPSQAIAVFSHGDPLKCLVCHFCCIPLDCILRFDLAPASVSVVDVGDRGSVVRCINRLSVY